MMILGVAITILAAIGFLMAFYLFAIRSARLLEELRDIRMTLTVIAECIRARGK